MIRLAVVAIIAGVAGIMLWQARSGECPGGTVVFSLEDCAGKLPGLACKQIYERADAVARRAGTVYQDPVECSTRFGPCLEHALVVGGWTPRPAGFCVLRAAGSNTTDQSLTIQPVYRADGGRSQR
jgi:uncharacterized protein YgiB involved in biofilm formation